MVVRKPPAGAAHDLARALDALQALSSNCPRDEWVRIGQAAHAAGLSFEEWDAWSSAAATYNQRASRDVWRSFRQDGGVRAGTLFFLAKAAGWKPDPNATRPPPPTPGERARAQAERAERQQRAAAAAADAVQRLAAAEPANPVHPYLARKGVAPCPAMRQEGAALLVPVMTPSGEVRGLQIIGADGAKRFSRGTSMAGCLFWARPPAEGPAALLIVTEGVADALTIATAIEEAAVACAWSAANLPAIAAALREGWPAAEIVIAADADEAGQRAAAKAQAADPRVVVRYPQFDRAR